MARLHVLPPDIITRVSEYVPEIVSFVEGIVKNGFAYEGGGSVWFDVEKFEGAEGDGFRHEYAKLQPANKANKKLLDEGEGASGHGCQTIGLTVPRRIDRLARKATSSRFCAVEGKVQARRASLAITLGRRSTGMAHRMLCHGERSAWQGDGHTFWRCGFDVSASR